MSDTVSIKHTHEPGQSSRQHFSRLVDTYSSLLWWASSLLWKEHRLFTSSLPGWDSENTNFTQAHVPSCLLQETKSLMRLLMRRTQSIDSLHHLLLTPLKEPRAAFRRFVLIYLFFKWTMEYMGRYCRTQQTKYVLLQHSQIFSSPLLPSW